MEYNNVRHLIKIFIGYSIIPSERTFNIHQVKYYYIEQ